MLNQGGATETEAEDWNRDLFSIFKEVPEPDKIVRAKTKKNTKVDKPAVNKSETGRLQLQGIVVSNGSYTALVDGRIVKQGDEVAGWKVRRIRRYSLEAEGPSGVKKFELEPGSEKSRVSSVPADK